MNAMAAILHRYNQAVADLRLDHKSEDAQAAREIASLPHDDDPEPGAFYGLIPPEPAPEPEPHHG